MNLLELSNALLQEGESFAQRDFIQAIPLPPNAPKAHQRAIAWIREAYEKVQQRKQDWDFHWVTGTLITTLADTSDYTKNDVRTVSPRSVNCRRQGETSVWPITVIEYAAWLALFRTTWPQLVPGVPAWLCQLPNGDWRLTPEPESTTTFEILADWQRTNHRLVRGLDEPLWHEDWHRLLVWEAAKSYLEEYDVPALGVRIQDNLPPLERSFYNRYVPEFWCP